MKLWYGLGHISNSLLEPNHWTSQAPTFITVIEFLTCSLVCVSMTLRACSTYPANSLNVLNFTINL